MTKRPRYWKARRPVEDALGPSSTGTLALLTFCLLAAFVQVDGAEDMAQALRVQAMLAGLGLAASVALDYRGSLRNLVRADLVCLSALYFLTFVEFLFPQPYFHLNATGFEIGKAARLTLAGMAALAVGRHADGLWSPDPSRRTRPIGGLLGGGLHVNHWFLLLWIAAGVGYLHMLLAVNFNPLAMIEAMIQPRFSQPWGRGKYGDWKALLYELSLFISIIPPIYGVLLAHRKRSEDVKFAFATAIALLTMFHGFSSGTRNVFATYLASLIGAYLLVQPTLNLRKAAGAAVIGVALLYVSTQQMLAFRQIGLENYLRYGPPQTSLSEEGGESFFVDANLFNIAMIVQAFDTRHEPLGWNVPYNALIRPIPRAIWPGKPEGLAVGIEDAVGIEGLTLSVTFIGEGYMMARSFGVILVGLFFGACCAFWHALFRGLTGAFPRLVYATGFVAAAISMRSLFSFTTAILPVIGLLALAWWLRGDAASESTRKRTVQSDAAKRAVPRSNSEVAGGIAEADSPVQ